MNKAKDLGFSMVELMIVIAIIGVLASFAIPQYQLYLTRSQASQALGLADSFKADIESYFTYAQALPCCGIGTGVASVGPMPINIPNNPRVASVQWNGTSATDHGEVEVVFTPEFSNGKGQTGPNAIVVLQAQIINGRITWLCGPKNDSTSGLRPQYLPASCRASSADTIPLK